MGEGTNGGRPEKWKIVEEWRKPQPDGRQAGGQGDTGLDTKQIRKGWKSQPDKCVYSVYNIHIERSGHHGKEASKHHDYSGNAGAYFTVCL
ncbi:hypothetical protein BGU93_18890 [Clostridioides difficile]|nr:hypothetical protein BGU93_18890 [Clostridioides difficile]